MLTLSPCNLCPRRCGADRIGGERGFCGMGATLRAARADLHLWEEPILAGPGGSGTVFFSGCTLQCAYCQNHEISISHAGRDLTSERLREIFLELIDRGAENIDLVTPTHFLPLILPALTPKLPVPVIYNCGGYESVETLRELEGLIDIYLPDFKYSDPILAEKLSFAPDYPQIAEAAIAEMIRQTGAPVFRGEGLIRGTVIRHLILPGCVDNALGVVERCAQWRNTALFSLMRQYTPMPGLQPPLDRPVTDDEAAAVLSWMELCSIEEGFYQEKSSADAEFIPKFDGFGVDKQGRA